MGGMEAERRQVTVLFTDMVGFTTFSEQSGEEAAYTLMQSLSKLMGERVREQGGIVQNFTGDGIMAVFGAPIAFEDAPLRACRAALAILQCLGGARLLPGRRHVGRDEARPAGLTFVRRKFFGSPPLGFAAPPLSVRMFGSGGKKRANASLNCAAL
jgi:class 3 adenylate cyclase